MNATERRTAALKAIIDAVFDESGELRLVDSVSTRDELIALVGMLRSAGKTERWLSAVTYWAVELRTTRDLRTAVLKGELACIRAN